MRLVSEKRSLCGPFFGNAFGYDQPFSQTSTVFHDRLVLAGDLGTKTTGVRVFVVGIGQQERVLNRDERLRFGVGFLISILCLEFRSESLDDAHGKIGFSISIQLLVPVIRCLLGVDKIADEVVDVGGHFYVLAGSCNFQNPAHFPLVEDVCGYPKTEDKIEIL